MTATVMLPEIVTIDGVVHVQQFRAEHYCVVQNYAAVSPPSDQPLITPGGQPTGASLFHLFEIIRINGAESLGTKLGTFSSLHAAMAQADRLAT